MHFMSKAVTLFVPGVVAMAIAPAYGAITFLDHFNSSSSWNINPANGDYAGGSGVAATSGSPTTDTGFFPGSTPANLAYKHTGAGNHVEFLGSNGNVQFTGPTSGGITVGAWVKLSGSSTPVSRILTLGDPDWADDILALDFGAAHDNTPRLVFRDGGTYSVLETPTTMSASDWVYLAASADLSNSQLKLYAYDATGALMGGSPVSGPLTLDGGWNLNNPLAVGHRVRIGGPAAPSTSLWVDELTIDGSVLSQSEISARVSSMIAGNQLAVPEPAGIAAMAVLGVLASRRGRRA